MKVCSTCSTEKPLDQFQKDKSKKDGLRNECKSCRSTRLKEWKDTPKGQANERRKNERNKNRRRHEPGFAQWRRGIVNKSMGREEVRIKTNTFKRTDKGKRIRAAHDAVERAIRRGEMVRPDRCQLCGSAPGLDGIGRSLVRAIHTEGYDEEHHLDVQFMCPECVERWKKTNRR